MTAQHSITTFTLDGQFKIRTDGDMVNLNDLYVAAGSPTNKEPRRWLDTESSIEAIDSVCKNLHVAKIDVLKTSKARVDRGGGTWAHKLLAVEYSGYLSPDFRFKVNETFLKVEEGDLSIVDRVFDNTKAPIEDQQRAVTRAQGKVVRNHHTAVLQAHDVSAAGFAICTNATYKPIFGGTKNQIVKERNLPTKANLRDHASLKEIAAILLAEILADEDIEKKRYTRQYPMRQILSAVC